MLLIIEMSVAVAARRRGWKGRGLLPFVLGFAFIFMADFLAGASRVRDASAQKPLGFVVDLVWVLDS